LKGQSLVFLLNLALSGVNVKMDIQPGILSLVLLDREFSPHPPVLESGLVPIFHALEPSGSFFLHFWVAFCVGVNFNIDLEEVLDGILPQSFLVAVFLETGSDQTKLGWIHRVKACATQ